MQHPYTTSTKIGDCIRISTQLGIFPIATRQAFPFQGLITLAGKKTRKEKQTAPCLIHPY